MAKSQRRAPAAKTEQNSPEQTRKTEQAAQVSGRGDQAARATTNRGRQPRRPRRRFSWARWFDEWRLAALGASLACRRPRFLVTVVVTFVILGTLMNLLTNGIDQFLLLFKLDWSGKWSVLASAFLATFGVGRAFLDWLFVFAVAFLQGILVGLVTLVWRYNRRAANTAKNQTAAAQANASAANTANAQSAGIVAGLAVLSAGCPTCGTSLLLPVIGTFTSAGGALAGTVSGVIYAIAIIVALWGFKRVGNEAYAIIITEKRGRL